jgi:hypothetical protein
MAQAAIGAAAPATTSKHCLWRVHSASNTVYFLGSIHLLRKDTYPLPEPIEAAYREATVVAFETDLAAMTQPATQMEMLNAGRCADGETLRDHLSPGTYSLLHSNIAVLLGAGDALDSCKPWLAAITALMLQLRKHGFDPDDGVDQHFFKRARRDKKEIRPLEEPAEVTRIMAGMSGADQEAMVRETLEEAANLMADMNAIVTAWRNGDVETIDRAMLETVRRYPEVYRQLLVERNEHWMPKVERLLREAGKPALVVVGAAHLIGKDSLLEMLGKKGFRVEQL